MNQWQLLMNQAAHDGMNYLNNIDNRPVFPDADSLKLLKQFDEPLPQTGQNAATVLDKLNQFGSPNTVASNGSKYFGFVVGGSYPIGMASKWLSTTWDQNAGMFDMSPVVAKLEEVTEKWLIDLFNLPSSTAVGFHSGSSEATLVGLMVARNTLLARQGYNVSEAGLVNCPPIKVVMSAEMHESIWKALNFLGLGRKNVTLVPTDDNGMMQSSKLPTIDAHTIVVIQAGNVNSGSFDSTEAIVDRVHQAGGWLHVDGAIGLWARVSKRYQHLVTGIERADSMSVDAHKLLNVPYDSGLLFCKERSSIVNALQSSANQQEINPDYRDNLLYTLEMSRRARIVELWSTLSYLGKDGVTSLVDQLRANTRYFAEQLVNSGCLVLNTVVFNQIVFIPQDSRQTASLLKGIQTGGLFWCGGTNWHDINAIRVSVSSWKTTRPDIDECIAFIQDKLRG